MLLWSLCESSFNFYFFARVTIVQNSDAKDIFGRIEEGEAGVFLIIQVLHFDMLSLETDKPTYFMAFLSLLNLIIHVLHRLNAFYIGNTFTFEEQRLLEEGLRYSSETDLGNKGTNYIAVIGVNMKHFRQLSLQLLVHI